ncbi:MAG: tRNA dihydrouridine synthase DusB [Dethiobacter sp.]|jgi:tRNA-dihydrouridine synthase B|nr:tRNA dihydrouridine synthase DusB [Dethiobacter sp.]MBS3983107.1 tRNA dihydrouridine synthase DusB [Dethiobacter sp.]MCL4463983.1 tRNA dihydrouridine synthase DusB [Bacillota bacterium]MCL5993591.1 tRNA dihydrouridine synthase DusB [Bacillota bacterium]
MEIGNITLKNQVILAPMAGVTDGPFRLLAKEMGCALVYTEMVSAKGVISAPEQTLQLARFAKEERPLGIQLFGSEPTVLAKAVAVCAAMEPDIFDINMGCPVKKVTGKGEGCALMREPKKAVSIVEAVCKTTTVPVTVKMRKGWDDQSVNVVEVAQAVEAAGAAAVTVHGRTREQGYSGKADWSAIARVKAVLKIPVIGNGDIWQPEDAKRMLVETGCDAVMIGRGSLGNLWLLQRTIHYLASGNLLPEPTIAERIELAKRQLDLVVNLKGEYSGVREMRKHLAWYFKGIPRAAAVRHRIMQAKTKAELLVILQM